MTKKAYKYIILIVIILFNYVSQAQHTHDKKTIKLFDKSKEAFYNKRYDEAEKFISKIIKRDSFFTDAYLLQTEIAIENNNPQKALINVNKIISIDAEIYPIAHLIKGNILFGFGRYLEAADDYKQYLLLSDKEDIAKLKKRIKSCYFRDSALQNPVSFNPINLGNNINSSNCEYVNSISLDGNKLYYTVRPINTPNEFFDYYKEDEDFFFSVKKDSVWQPSLALSDNINSPYNEGAMNISADGQYLFFTSCRSGMDNGGCDLYYAIKEDGNWGTPNNLGPSVNTPAWETQPCFSSDGQTLYFVSTRAGGQGKSDIWKTKIDINGHWTTPENLGEQINTNGDEMAPYIHPDGKTLYFSSTGHIGMGKADLFISYLQDDGSWSKPINLGYPINTSNDEINIIVAPNGDDAYISVEDSVGFGCFDIKHFNLPENLKPSPVSYLKGNIFDKETNIPLQSLFEVVDLENNNTIVKSFSDKNGNFLIALPSEKEYGLYVTKKDYLYYSENFPFNQHVLAPLIKDIALTKIQAGGVINLSNLFFAFDSDSLLQKSYAELQNIVRFLKKNKYLKIEIAGYTDDIGSKDYNIQLAENRAYKVYSYLINEGINKSRLQYKGYGEANPLYCNDSENNRAKNRRTEMKIL